MATQIQTSEREVVLVEDAHVRSVMGIDTLEPLPSRNIPSPTTPARFALRST